MTAQPMAILENTRRPLWRRWLADPVLAQLRQGITPEKIAFTLALGFALSIFPILGSTTLLCALAGVLCRLNQPIIQLVNYLAYPVQIALLIPFYRAGESIFHRPHVPLSIPLFFERIHADFGQFLKDFGLIALQGIVVWMLVAPLLVAAIYFSSRAPLRTAAARIRH